MVPKESPRRTGGFLKKSLRKNARGIARATWPILGSNLIFTLFLIRVRPLYCLTKSRDRARGRLHGFLIEKTNRPHMIKLIQDPTHSFGEVIPRTTPLPPSSSAGTEGPGAVGISG